MAKLTPGLTIQCQGLTHSIPFSDPRDEEVAQPGQKAGKPYFAYSKHTMYQSTVLKKREQQTHLISRRRRGRRTLHQERGGGFLTL